MEKALDGANLPRITSLTVRTPNRQYTLDDALALSLTSRIIELKLQSFTIHANLHSATRPRIVGAFSLMKKFAKLCEDGRSPEVVYSDLDGTWPRLIARQRPDIHSGSGHVATFFDIRTKQSASPCLPAEDGWQARSSGALPFGTCRPTILPSIPGARLPFSRCRTATSHTWSFPPTARGCSSSAIKPPPTCGMWSSAVA